MALTPDQAQRVAGLLLTPDPAEPSETGSRLAGGPPPAGYTGRIGPGPFGRYTVMRLVGVGGMGEVYEAQQDNPARRVALKIIRPELLSPDLARRFDHEARVLGRLQHPGIAQIFEAGRAEAPSGVHPYFAMEYVEGLPLTTYARERGLSVRQRLELFLKVCDAVEHAHRKGVIHRDLKPGNILVGADGQPRVLDFGVARTTDSDVQATSLQTDVGKLVGTLPYMSPEQVAGDPDALDTRSDVYALGVVLYELLGGRAPYELAPGRVYEAARIIRETDPAPLSSIDRVFRGDIDTIVGKALEKDRGRRYQSVGDLAGDVRRHLENEPIVARPASAAYQLSKFARRHRGLAAGLAAAVVASVLGGAACLAFALAETRARHGAEEIGRRERTAREEADRDRAEALRQLTIARVTIGFMEDVFSGATPQVRQGRDISAMDLLDMAAAKATVAGHESKETAAAIRFAIGTAYMRAGKPDRAREHLAAALDLRREVYGPDHPSTLDAQSQLANIDADLGDTDAAVLSMREVLAKRRALLGDDDPATARIAGNLGSQLLDAKRLDEAEPLLEAAASANVVGDDVLRAKHNLAALRLEQGRTEEAEQIIRQVIQGRRELLGSSHPSVLDSLSLLAGVQRRLGHLTDAVATLREVLGAKQRVLGAEHPDTLLEMSNLAGYLLDQGELSEAEPLAQRVRDERHRLLGPLHPDTLASQAILARILCKAKRFDEAESLLQQMLRDVPDLRSQDRNVRALIQRLLGDCLIAAGKYEQAEPHLLAAYRFFLNNSSRANPRAVQARDTLHGLYQAWGKPDEAAKYLPTPTPAPTR
jgi:eukaryotic-like serine/threonine-protein kinase